MGAARAQTAPQSQRSQQSTSPASSSPPGSAPTAGKTTNQSGIKLAKWGISLIQPMWMTVFLLLGILLAVGHHLYYASLEGSTTGSASRQQWPIRFGTAFAYLITTCLNAAVGLAFTQQLWRSVRQKSFSVNSIDKIFGITTDPTGFWSLEVLGKAKIVSLIALTAWILPFAGIVPPATLTVDILPRPHVSNMAFGVPNWNTVNLITSAIGSVATIPSDVMLQLAWQTAERSEILPVEAPAVNSSYGLSFFGPTMRCAPPNDAQKAAIDYYVTRIRNESGLYVAADIDNTSDDYPPSPTIDLVYSAFSPRFSEMLNDPSVDATYNGWRPELGSFNPSNPLRSGVLQDALLQELWIQLSDQSIVCQLANASFDVHIEFINGAQMVTSKIATLPEYNQTYLAESDSNCSDWDTEAYCTEIYLSTPQMNYIGWYGALASLLNGNITLNTHSGDGNDYNVTTNMLLQTGLASCPELANDYWSNYCETIGASEDFCGDGNSGNTTRYFPEAESYFCRNGSLARAIEDLANNITISLLSIQQLAVGSTVAEIDDNSLTNRGVTIPVTITKFVNVYTYDWRNLVISYAVAAAFALGAVLLGAFAFRQNGVSHVSSFSAIVATTRNVELDALTEGQCLGALPISKDFGRTRLRLGIIGKSTEKVDHVAFGLEGNVQHLQRGLACS
jgi:hypothetical protein